MEVVDLPSVNIFRGMDKYDEGIGLVGSGRLAPLARSCSFRKR